MTELAFNIAAYVVPLAVLPYVVRAAPMAKRVAVFALFVSPLLGAAAFVAADPHEHVEPGLRLLARLGTTYPFALFPFGFWAAALGAAASSGLHQLHQQGAVHTPGLVLAGVLGGVVIGGCFMTAFAAVGAAIRGEALPPGLVASWYVAAGALAGATVGMFAAVTTSRSYGGESS